MFWSKILKLFPNKIQRKKILIFLKGKNALLGKMLDILIRKKSIEISLIDIKENKGISCNSNCNPNPYFQTLIN